MDLTQKMKEDRTSKKSVLAPGQSSLACNKRVVNSLYNQMKK